MHDTLGRITGVCTSASPASWHPWSALSPASRWGIWGCLRHTTHIPAHTHTCGKTKSHRVCMYVHNSHAFLLMLNKSHWPFWKLMLSKPKQTLITEKTQTLELRLHSCLVKYTNLILVSFLGKTEILKGFLIWFTFVKLELNQYSGTRFLPFSESP